MILVTGGAGYIGSHCALELLRQGYDVVIFDNLETGHIEIVNKLKQADFKGKIIDFIKGDLRNSEDISEVFKKHKIEAVIHFAAYSLVEESVKNPAKYYMNNVYGSMNLFNAMVENDVKKIVFSSTCATYGEPTYVPIDEKHPQSPINPYGMSKLMIEKILDDYNMAYNLKSVRLRYFNVAGASETGLTGEWHDIETHLIPNILKSTFNQSKTFKMFGEDYDTPDGTCIRDYVNVEDLAEAHILALKYLSKGGETDFFNVGTGNGDSVKSVFEACEKITETKIPVEKCARRAGDPAKLIADNRKVKEFLKWNNKRTLENSVKTAYNWEKELNKSLILNK